MTPLGCLLRPAPGPTIADVTDINWPAWSVSGPRLLELMPMLAERAFTRGEVEAVAAAWRRAWAHQQYRDVRLQAFHAMFDRRPNTIDDDAEGVARKRAEASGEWREDVIRDACNAATDAAIARYVADALDPADLDMLTATWSHVIEHPPEPIEEVLEGPEVPLPDPALVEEFTRRSQERGWDETAARDVTKFPPETLSRCRALIRSAGRESMVRGAMSAATFFPTPGGCWPDETTMLVDSLEYALSMTSEAVVARDLLSPTDFDALTAWWRRNYGEFGT